jgi:CspA family cold shock protein
MSELVGTVKWFDEKKGYGFIESGGKEYFFHFSEIQVEGYKTIGNGWTVKFQPFISDRGIRASKVSICNID